MRPTPGPGRTLRPEEIPRGILLDPEELARYSEQGTVITDDNQLLAQGQFHSKVPNQVYREIVRRNMSIMARITGRRPFLLSPDRLEATRRELSR